MTVADGGHFFLNDSTYAGLDEEELRAAFTVKSPASSKGGNGGGGGGGGSGGAAAKGLMTPRGGVTKKVMLLELKRSNQISIALAKFKPKSHEQVAHALLALDESLIKVEDIARLRSCIPTPDELELLTPYLSATSASEAERVAAEARI